MLRGNTAHIKEKKKLDLKSIIINLKTTHIKQNSNKNRTNVEIFRIDCTTCPIMYIGEKSRNLK